MCSFYTWTPEPRMRNFVKILLKFDKILTTVWQNSPESSCSLGAAGSASELAAVRTVAAAGSGQSWRRTPLYLALRPGGQLLTKFCQIFVKILSNFSNIFTNLCIQYSIFQHFSKATRFYKIQWKFCKNFVNHCKFLHFSTNFQKILKNFATFREILQNFAN